MRLKRFSIISLLLILAIGAYIYSFEDGQYAFVHLNKFYSAIPAVELPIALWIVLPGLLVFLYALIHFGVLNISGYFREKTFQKDYKNLIEQIRITILGEHKEFLFKTKRYQELSAILKQFEFKAKDITEETEVERIDCVLKAISELQKGNTIDLKLFAVSGDNALVEHNELNRLEQNEKFALEIFKKPASYTTKIKEKAFDKLLDFAEEKEIKRCLGLITLNKPLSEKLFEKFVQNTISLSSEEIRNIAKDAGYMKNDYIALAKKLKERFPPDSWIGLFEYLADHDENAEESIIYVLLELEMVDRAKERINNAPDENMQKFEAYLALKECDRHFPIDIFVS